MAKFDSLCDRPLTETQVQTLRLWLQDVSQGQSWRRYDDIHVDQISHAWKKRSLWVVAGLRALKVATRLRDELHLPFAVTLAIALQDGRRPAKPPVPPRGRLLQMLHVRTPPSLYLLPRRSGTWQFIVKQSSPVRVFLNLDPKVRSSVSSYWHDIDKIWVRTLWVWIDSKGGSRTT